MRVYGRPSTPGRWLIAVILAACAGSFLTAAQNSPPEDPVEQLRDDITVAMSSPGVQRGQWGIAVHSLSTDERLVDVNPGTLLVPGSISKLVTVATAVEAVGWNYRFETELRGTGAIVDGTLQGDLLVVGSGDPSPNGRGGDNLSVWIDALKALGVTRIAGRVIGDDDDLEEPRPQLSWAWDDLGYTSGAIFGALNLDENVMAVTIAPGSRDGEPTTLSEDPIAIDRPLINRTVTGPRGSRQLLWPEQRPGETALTIAGSIPVGAAPARLSVSVGNPTAWFANVLRRRLILGGIEVTGGAFDIDDLDPRPSRQAATLLYTHTSKPLSEIVRPLLKESINLYGEALLRLNAPRTGPLTNDAALAGMEARLILWGIPPDGQQIVDGSGLSRRNVVSPETIIAILRRMHDPSATSPFVAALPVAGVDGSLRNRLRQTPAEGTVRAKTGTMSNVRALAGYVTTRDGEPLAFVIMVNNFEGSGASALTAIDTIAGRLADFSRNAN